MSNVRKSTVSKKTNKDKDADKASTKKGPVGQVADSEAVTKQRKSSSQSKRSQKSKVSAKAKRDEMDDVVKDDSITGENVNLI